VDFVWFIIRLFKSLNIEKNTRGKMFLKRATLDARQVAWDSAVVVDEYNPDRIRQDACGAWIAYDDFNNKNSLFGWEIDYIFPLSRLQQLGVPQELWNHPLNIRALHWKNRFSKGNSYPRYTSTVVDGGATNMEQHVVFWVSDPLQYKLQKVFKLKNSLLY